MRKIATPRVRRPRGRVDAAIRLLSEELEDGLANVGFLEDEAALAIDDVALVVEDVVELECTLADIEVAPLDLDLRLCDRAGDHAGLDRRRVVEAEARHETGDALGGKDADEVVFE